MTRRPLAAVPTGPVVVPDAVRALAGDDVTTPVWRNELGGLTFRLDGADGTRFAKWVPAGTPEIDLSGEAARLAWVGDRAPVPHVLAQGSDDDGAWLVTRAVPGRSAVEPRWVADPATAALAIGSRPDALGVDQFIAVGSAGFPSDPQILSNPQNAEALRMYATLSENDAWARIGRICTMAGQVSPGSTTGG